MDPLTVVSDLLRAVTLALVGVCGFYVREVAQAVKELRKEHGDKLANHREKLDNHGERIARIEGANHV